MAQLAVAQKDGRTTEAESKYFPKVNPGFKPFGSRVLVQIRGAKSMSAGGIIFTETTKDTERDNTQVAKVIAIGPLAYRNRNTMEPWPEGSWCAVGEYVYVPKYGGIRFERKVPPGVQAYDDYVQFAVFDDLNLIGDVEDPLVDKPSL